MKINWIEIVVLCFFGFWLLATILYTFFNRRLARYTNRWDIFRLLSSYQLFARSAKKYQLFYRDKLNNGQETAWQEIHLNSPYRLSHALWFPQRQTHGTLLSMIDDMATLTQQKNQNNKITNRFLYRQISRFVKQQPSIAGSKAERQFKITSSGSNYIFISEFER
ncbi:MAG: hypothetical protein ACKOXB_06210 [Flavobacteriales bacterium]